MALTGSLVGAGLLVVTAQAAGASWLMLDTPSVPNASEWEFTAVSCTAPQNCMAVGDSFGNTSQLLSEIRTKSGWTIKHVPEPAAGGGTLGSVWCTFSYSCIAVGDASNGSGGFVPLTERWNGSSWKIQNAPQPAGTLSSELNAVKCTTAFDCTAVGSAFPSLNSEVPLVEHWNGLKWKIETAPTRKGFIESELRGVSCPIATRCFAVGDSFKTSPHPEFVSLVETWNGSKWTIQTTPNPANGGDLNQVACLTRTDCFAVGDGYGERWNGKKWSLLKIANPSGGADLFSISCRTGVCYADGDIFVDGVQQGVIEFWNGSRWRVQDASINTSFDSSVYTGIYCTTEFNCTAVGSYHDPTNGDRALAQDFSLRWQNVSPTPFSGVTGTFLNAVSCASPNSCVAVGTFSTATANDSFSDTWDGAFWTAQTMPKQASTFLNSVSCKTSTFCIAVGQRSTSTGDVTVAERWNGIKWVIQKTPNPAGATISFLNGVSCPATNACTAVGEFATNSGSALLALQWNGTSWRRTTTPHLTHRSSLAFRAVSCASTKACEAIAGSTQGPFAERWNGTSWKAQTTPLQKGGQAGSLGGVSCATASSCVAVGEDLRGAQEVPISEHWNGTAWKAQRAASPPHVTVSNLSAVSCASASQCEAVGFASSPVNNAMAEHWNGRTWSLQSIAVPFGSNETDLSSLSCNSPSACMSVGFFVDTMDETLAEQFS